MSVKRIKLEVHDDRSDTGETRNRKISESRRRKPKESTSVTKLKYEDVVNHVQNLLNRIETLEENLKIAVNNRIQTTMPKDDSITRDLRRSTTPTFCSELNPLQDQAIETIQQPESKPKFKTLTFLHHSKADRRVYQKIDNEDLLKDINSFCGNPINLNKYSHYVATMVEIDGSKNLQNYKINTRAQCAKLILLAAFDNDFLMKSCSWSPRSKTLQKEETERVPISVYEHFLKALNKAVRIRFDKELKLRSFLRGIRIFLRSVLYDEPFSVFQGFPTDQSDDSSDGIEDLNFD